MRRFCIPPKTGGKLVRLAERRTVHEGLSSGGYENQSLHDLTWRRRFTEALAGANPQLNGKTEKVRKDVKIESKRLKRKTKKTEQDNGNDTTKEQRTKDINQRKKTARTDREYNPNSKLKGKTVEATGCHARGYPQVVDKDPWREKYEGKGSRKW